ncbi:LPPG:FO 2-phospho-L-lactate transferase CofD/UPF0052 [Penicillium expansum]|nr:LPPG:FO 2-phospho-L-lactate transferase CofD/UPF0052 [Penicillium expansum]
MATNRGIVVISGGSAANNLVDVFNAVRESKNCPLSYIIPISDNGGSSSELIRIFGGPGIGDVRSRLVRLIPDSPANPERSAVKALFNHRLPAEAGIATNEWQSIVDGTSELWTAITPWKLRKCHLSPWSICGVPSDLVRVIPAINSNFSHHISASLADGTVIVGQNSISHPSEATALEHNSRSRRPSLLLADGDDVDYTDSEMSDPTTYEEDHLPGSLATLRNKNIKFSKTENEDLSSRITRIWYINPYGQEIRPPANPRVLEAINDSQAIIYSIGSLYTSIIPAIVLRGVGKSIVSSPARHKILILNGSLDRETGPPSAPFSASDFVEAIVSAGEESRGRGPIIHAQHQSQTPAKTSGQDNVRNYRALPYTNYVTHILHLDGPGTPHVDRERLTHMGIETLRLYGRKIMSKDGDKETVVGMQYDPNALVQAIEVVLGKKGDAMVRGGLGNALGRRNTLDPARRDR